jgi:hypothetical protein
VPLPSYRLSGFSGFLAVALVQERSITHPLRGPRIKSRAKFTVPPGRRPNRGHTVTPVGSFPGDLSGGEL